jgi:hypothetical protein
VKVLWWLGKVKMDGEGTGVMVKALAVGNWFFRVMGKELG